MDPASTSSQGLFLADTRFLSRFQLRINGLQPVLMGSSEEILFQSSFIFTNPELAGVPARGLGILQHNKIGEEAVHISVTVANWSLKTAEFEISIELESDFFDSFEARGVKRLKRGKVLPIRSTKNSIELGYLGLDDVTRKTEIQVSPSITRFSDRSAYFEMQLENGQRTTIDLEIQLVMKAPEGISLQPAPERTRHPAPPWFRQNSKIVTGNPQVDLIVNRSIDDLEVLFLQFEDAWVPAAGLPRFSVPFGRDSLITSLQTLVLNPHIARDALRFLAHRQGKEENPWNYEQPGKIMHELHTGEIARLKEVPFGLFYGTVDSTPLFLVLGAEYIRWTGDLALYRELKSNFEAAWSWVEKYGDIDGTGYVQYQAHTPPKSSTAALTVGLFNQGWKDSAAAVTYADGTMVTDHPVALSEVQGDLYRALHLWGQLYLAMPESEGMHKRGRELERRAAELKKQFNREFWMPEKGYYAMGIDGSHRPIDSITSNPAECLWARLIDDEHAGALCSRIMDESMFTSWGVRTMANTEKAYNPFSYHNGSIWPFENAIIAAGLKKYGLAAETQRVFDAMVDASLYFEYRRWPEVYAGVGQDIGGVIARQPDASRPQAWSAGAIFLLAQTILGAATRPFSGRVDITPVLPSRLNEIRVDNLSIADTSLSLRLVRDGDSVLLEIVDNPGHLDIVVHPAVPYGMHIDSETGPAVSH